MLDVRRLRLLRELDRRGSIAAVADAMSFSPSAISQQFAQLERETGVRLLERVGRGVRLTPAARSLVGQIDRVVEQLDEIETSLARVGDDTAGTVTLATFQSAGSNLVPGALVELTDTAPSLRVEVMEAEAEVALPALLRGEVDLVIADDYPGNPRAREAQVHREDLCVDPMMLALPSGHPLAAPGGPVRLADLAEAPWAFALPDTFYAQMATRTCNEVGGFAPEVRHRVSDLTVVVALVGAGHAVAFVPALLGLDHPKVALRPVAERPLDRTLFTAARRSSATHPAIAAVRAALKRQASRGTGDGELDTAPATAPVTSTMPTSSRTPSP